MKDSPPPDVKRQGTEYLNAASWSHALTSFCIRALCDLHDIGWGKLGSQINECQVEKLREIVSIECYFHFDWSFPSFFCIGCDFPVPSAPDSHKMLRWLHVTTIIELQQQRQRLDPNRLSGGFTVNWTSSNTSYV